MHEIRVQVIMIKQFSSFVFMVVCGWSLVAYSGNELEEDEIRVAGSTTNPSVGSRGLP
jgi:hypothetical protein